MARFDRQIKTALRLIKKNGQSCIWNEILQPSEDANSPWIVEDVLPIQHNVEIAFFTVDKENQETFNTMSETLIPMGSLLGLMGNFNFKPSMFDSVIRDGEVLKVKSIDVLSPNGQQILNTVVFDR